MSVPEWKRTENELNIFIEAKEFCLYFLRITANENVFDPKFKETITDRLNTLALDIYLNLWRANNIRLEKTSIESRRSLQKLALQNIVDFVALYNLGIRAFHLKSKRTEFIMEKLTKIEDSTKKWISSDTKRLEESEP